VLVSVASNLGMLWAMFARHEHSLATLAPTWLLPIVATVVAAASGGVVADTLAPFNPALARGTLYVSWAVWGTGVPIALMVISLLIYRFAAGGPPAPAALASVFLPLGPCGQGSFGITTLGVVARKLATAGTPMVPSSPEASLRIADGMYAACLLAGLVLWGLALAWYVLAVAMFAEGVRRDPALLSVGKFTVGLWALTFPIGVWATASIVLAAELDSPAMRVIAAFISAQVILHWAFVAAMTVWKMVRGELFSAPELEGRDVPMRWERDVELGKEQAPA
jgi:tellurite resistance protein TehA-like permease